jgi:TolB-like protein/cytochrome c-type biogenesis protein CcmH/NrfG
VVAKAPKRRFASWHDLSAELIRRRVYPVTAAYAVVAFILLQIGEITFAPLGLPNWVMVSLIGLVIAGFPVVIVLAWLFDLTPAGIRRDRRDLPAAAGPSVAVLPFSDMSPEKDQGYFCEGIAEEILNSLSRIRELKVAARSSAFQYKAGSGDVRKIGEDLGVSTVLEGSVRKADERVRITAQLVSTTDGYHLWSKTFDGNLEDVFAFQDEIATAIAGALNATISHVQSAISTTSTKDVLAYEYYLRGRQYFKRFRKVDIENARQMFRQAIDIDPDFAAAWAGYADCHSFLVMYVDPRAEYRDTAAQASRRALELDPDLAEAHASRGLALLVCEQYEAAEAEFRMSIEQNPNLFEAYYYYARTCFHQGKLEQSAELFQQAAAADPADYQSRCLRVQILRGNGEAATAAKEAAAAVQVVEQHLQWNPDDSRAYHLGAGSLALTGDIGRAKKWLHRAVELSPDDPVVMYNVACNLATFGEADAALDYLEKAVDVGAVSLAWMQNDEDLASVRDHPRYVAMLERIAAAGHSTE